MKKPIEEVIEKASQKLGLRTNHYEAQEVIEARRLLNEHYENNFGPMLEALIRCKEVFINDDWEGPLKNQIIEAIEAASTVEVS